MHLVVLGAHPDDPESGCGGTIIKHRRDGDRVTVLYATSGPKGIREKPEAEAFAIARFGLAERRLAGP